MLVDGHCVARHLAALTIEVGKFIESSNYEPGSTGWRIDGAGNLEANDGTFRGTVAAQAVVASTSFTADDAIFDGNVHCQGLNIEFGLTAVGTLELDNPPGASPPVIGVFGATPVTKRSVTGSTADAKVDSLISAMAQYGWITDNTT